MQNIAFIDKAFDVNQIKSTLSIQASLNGFSFCILDNINRKYVILKHFKLDKYIDEKKYLSDISNIIDNEDLFKRNYERTEFIFITRKSTLVPDELFDLSNIKLFFQFNQDIDDLDELHYNKLEKVGAHNIFAVPNQLAIILTRKFKNIKFHHQASPFLKNVIQKDKEILRTRFFVNFHTDFFDLAVIKNRKLLLYNTFNFQHENDIVYYILSIYKQLKLNPGHIALVVSGDVLEDSNTSNMLKSYIADVSFEQLDKHFGYSLTFNTSISRTFTNLFNLLR